MKARPKAMTTMPQATWGRHPLLDGQYVSKLCTGDCHHAARHLASAQGMRVLVVRE
jgi:hypothetical protein